MTLKGGLGLAFCVFLLSAGISCMFCGPPKGAHLAASLGAVAFVVGLIGIGVIWDRFSRS